MKKLIVLALMILASAASAAETGRYLASNEDETVAGMVTRWGTQDGRAVRWDAIYDVAIRDAAGINKAAHLESASTLDDAVKRVLKVLAEVSETGELRGRHAPLASCVYNDGEVYMVIRMLGDSCRKAAD